MISEDELTLALISMKTGDELNIKASESSIVVRKNKLGSYVAVADERSFWSFQRDDPREMARELSDRNDALSWK